MESLFGVIDTVYCYENDAIILQKDTLPVQDTVTQKFASLVAQSKATGMKEQIRINNTSDFDWGLMLILGAFVLVSIGKYVYPRKLRLFFQASFGINYMNQLLREWSPAKNAVGFCCFMMHSLIQTLFFTILIVYYKTSDVNAQIIEIFYRIYLVILTVYAFRFVMNRLLSWLFKTADVTLRYRTLTLSISTITAVFLMPLMLIMMYNPAKIFFVIGGGFIVTMFVFKFFRTFFEIVSITEISIFYIFLYLCTLEIVPVLLALKFVMGSLLQSIM